MKLQLAPTVRPAHPNEIPGNSDAHTRLQELDNANIVEGYVIKENEKKDIPFSFYAGINIDNSKLWDLFLALCTQLPEAVSFIYNFYDDDPTFGKYLSKKTVVAMLSNFQLELVQDCFLEFGLVFHDNEVFTEIFVKESKYIQFWGNDRQGFDNIMKNFSLQHIPELNFIDEFPKTVERLTKFNTEARSTEEIISSFDKYFSA